MHKLNKGQESSLSDEISANALEIAEKFSSGGFQAVREWFALTLKEVANLELPETVEVPVKPTPGLLVSMAMRDRHDFGLLDKTTQDACMRSMSQLHEEVVLRGFYQPYKEEGYASRDIRNV